MGDEFHRLAKRLRPLGLALDEQYEGSWKAWWDAVRLEHEPPGMISRLLGRRKVEF